MSKNKILSVESYAQELGLPIFVLAEQLRDAGINKCNNEDDLTESDRVLFLNYLRNKYSVINKQKHKINKTNKINTFTKEILDKKNKNNAQKAFKSVDEANELRDRLLLMSLPDLKALWLKVNNDEFSDDDKKLLKVVINIKSKNNCNEQ